MPNGYKNQPISGFTGYIPGAKWQVGSRYVPGSRENSGFVSRNTSESGAPQIQTQYAPSGMNTSKTMGGDAQMKNFTEMTNEELRERLMKMQMDMQNIQMTMNMQQQHSERVGGGGSDRHTTNFAVREEPTGPTERRSEYENGQRGQQDQLKQRSKSVPRKIESNPFDGIESGWWSKGEVKRNQERREIANGGQMVSGGNWNQRPPSRQRVSRKLGALEKDETEDIPAAGYSGHIQGLRHIGVGKSFNVAAKQAKKEYIERRRTYSGSRDTLNGRGRGTQFSEEVLSANVVKLPDNRF